MNFLYFYSEICNTAFSEIMPRMRHFGDVAKNDIRNLATMVKKATETTKKKIQQVISCKNKSEAIRKIKEQLNNVKTKVLETFDNTHKQLKEYSEKQLDTIKQTMNKSKEVDRTREIKEEQIKQKKEEEESKTAL